MNFNHKSVLLNESIDALNIKEDGIYVDGTAGGGGHSVEILKCSDDGEVSTFFTLGGMPNDVAFTQNDIYFADISNGVIYEKKNGQNDIIVLLKSYEGSPMKGPSSIVANKTDNFLIFCDSGYFGTTSLNTPNGSVFHIDLNNNIVNPILLNCLAHPSDIVYDEHSGVFYIAETFRNRIIRVTQNPIGIFHSSVFHTFNGRIGPTALAIDELGNIYVSRYEYQNEEGKKDGIISIINKEGVEVGEITIEGLPYVLRPDTCRLSCSIGFLPAVFLRHENKSHRLHVHASSSQRRRNMRRQPSAGKL